MRSKNKHIQLDEDIPFQNISWDLQRIGFFLFSVIVIAALLGFTGTGGLFNSTQLLSPALQLRYPYYVRRDAPISFDVTLINSDQFWLDQEFINHYQIDTIVPEPREVVFTDNRLLYKYARATDEGKFSVRINVKPEKIGLFTGTIGQARDKLLVEQFVLP